MRSFLIFLFFFLSFKALAQELRGYEVYNKGIYNIEDGFILQGSSDFGGIQPNYKIDLYSDLKMKDFLNYSRDLRSLPTDEKMAKIFSYIKQTLRKGSYSEPSYLKLLKKYKKRGEPIPISEYINCSAGVCRENALFLHLGLKEAGVENRYVYAKVEQSYGGYVHSEDHAFVIYRKDSGLYIADSYNNAFNGKEFKSLLGKKLNMGETDHYLSIKNINKYPNLYIPSDKFHPRLITIKNPCKAIYKVSDKFDDILTRELVLANML